MGQPPRGVGRAARAGPAEERRRVLGLLAVAVADLVGERPGGVALPGFRRHVDDPPAGASDGSHREGDGEPAGACHRLVCRSRGGLSRGGPRGRPAGCREEDDEGGAGHPDGTAPSAARRVVDAAHVDRTWFPPRPLPSARLPARPCGEGGLPAALVVSRGRHGREPAPRPDRLRAEGEADLAVAGGRTGARLGRRAAAGGPGEDLERHVGSGDMGAGRRHWWPPRSSGTW